jgi:hypothetical protein
MRGGGGRRGREEEIERRERNWRRERSRVEAREGAEVGAVDGGGLEMLELAVGEAQAQRQCPPMLSRWAVARGRIAPLLCTTLTALLPN